MIFLLLKKWISRRDYNSRVKATIALCQNIYQNIPSFHLAKLAREQELQHAYEFIYGEINYYSFARLLGFCTITPHTLFYDLGSGAGKAVIFISQLYELKMAVGIERLKLLHEAAVQAQEKTNGTKTLFYQSDILEFNWLDADLIFVNAATFIGDFWTTLLQRLKTLKPGAQLIVVSKRLPAESFNLIHEDLLPMSWGTTRVGVYMKK